jgi:hypothetical protein
MRWQICEQLAAMGTAALSGGGWQSEFPERLVEGAGEDEVEGHSKLENCGPPSFFSFFIVIGIKDGSISQACENSGKQN